jgi:two-component system, NarL family, nitrate/nitrite response regulator NarL
MRLYLIDDHALFREGLYRLLSGHAGWEMVGHSGKVDEAIAQLREIQVDVLILDYDLGEQTAVHVMERLKETAFAGKVLLVTAGLPDRAALQLIRAGISGIFHKQNPPDALERCIREVAQGQVLIEQRYLQSLVTTTETSSLPGLSERERRILHSLLEGLSNKEIGAELGISESAVKAALQQLFAKTGVRTRSQLVRLALETDGYMF